MKYFPAQTAQHDSSKVNVRKQILLCTTTYYSEWIVQQLKASPELALMSSSKAATLT